MSRYEYCSIEFSVNVVGWSIYTVSRPGENATYYAGNHNEGFLQYVAELEKDGWILVRKGSVGWFNAYYFMRVITDPVESSGGYFNSGEYGEDEDYEENNNYYESDEYDEDDDTQIRPH